MSKKLVERKDLHHLVSELFFIKLQSPSRLQGRIENLIEFVEKSILQSDNESKNEMKRVIYKKMKEAPTPEESRQWYDLYKSIDTMCEYPEGKETIITP